MHGPTSGDPRRRFSLSRSSAARRPPLQGSQAALFRHVGRGTSADSAGRLPLAGVRREPPDPAHARPARSYVSPSDANHPAFTLNYDGLTRDHVTSPPSTTVAESFPTGDFPRAGATDRTAMGERFSFGCTYFLEAGIEGSCTYGFDLDPGVYEPYPCMRVTNVCLEHNHPHDLSPELWDECKEEEDAYVPKGIAAVQEGAIDRLLELRKTLDYRCGDPESFKDYLDSKLQEQDFIIKSWDWIPDARARTELRRKTERILIRRENYPILPPLPPRGVTFSTSRSAPCPSSSSSPSASTSTRTSQAPAPGLERKAKRAASPSPEPEAKVSLHKVSPTDRSRLWTSSCTRLIFLLTLHMGAAAGMQKSAPQGCAATDG